MSEEILLIDGLSIFYNLCLQEKRIGSIGHRGKALEAAQALLERTQGRIKELVADLKQQEDLHNASVARMRYAMLWSKKEDLFSQRNRRLAEVRQEKVEQEKLAKFTIDKRKRLHDLQHTASQTQKEISRIEQVALVPASTVWSALYKLRKRLALRRCSRRSPRSTRSGSRRGACNRAPRKIKAACRPSSSRLDSRALGTRVTILSWLPTIQLKKRRKRRQFPTLQASLRRLLGRQGDPRSRTRQRLQAPTCPWARASCPSHSP